MQNLMALLICFNVQAGWQHMCIVNVCLEEALSQKSIFLLLVIATASF